MYPWSLHFYQRETFKQAQKQEWRIRLERQKTANKKIHPSKMTPPQDDQASESCDLRLNRIWMPRHLKVVTVSLWLNHTKRLGPKLTRQTQWYSSMYCLCAFQSKNLVSMSMTPKITIRQQTTWALYHFLLSYFSEFHPGGINKLYYVLIVYCWFWWDLGWTFTLKVYCINLVCCQQCMMCFRSCLK